MMPGIIFIGPISEARELVCYAVFVVAGRAGHIAIPLGFVRVDHPVVTLDAGCENPLRVPSRLRRGDASRAKHECRNQRGGETTNHVKPPHRGCFCTVLPCRTKTAPREAAFPILIAVEYDLADRLIGAHLSRPVTPWPIATKNSFRFYAARRPPCDGGHI
jgi:hypothetical protein